jgi:hypothetical protein
MSVDQFLLSADTTDLNYPEIRPTLDLNFARVKALDPRITFTRSSGGSYVGADGLIKYAGVNEARFDHDPVTGESLGLLVEESRTNLLLNSNTDVEFSNASNPNLWSSGQLAPDGSLTAKICTTNNRSFVQYSSISVNNVISTFSIYLKTVSSSLTRTLQLKNFASDIIVTTKTITITSNWQKFDITGQVSTNGVRIEIFGGILDIFAWGAQLEQGAFPTSYIPTQASTRTRAADNASITGKNFSDFFNFNEGTSFVSFKFGPTTLNSRTFLRFLSGTTGTIWQRSNDAGTLHALTFSPDPGPSINLGIPNTEQFTSPYLDGNSIFSYKFGDIAYSTSGQVQYTNNYTFLPLNDLQRPTDRLFIGRRGSESGHLNGTIKRLTYFPKRLPNAQLQALTR